MVLVASSIVLSYAVWMAATVTRAYYRFVYECDALDVARRAMIPEITQFALGSEALVICLICALGILTAWSCRRHASPLALIAGVTGQLLVVWALGFCLCFGGFTDGGCLHHGPAFEFAQFLSAGYGLFPVTLVAILLPLVSAVAWGRRGSGI